MDTFPDWTQFSRELSIHREELISLAHKSEFNVMDASKAISTCINIHELLLEYESPDEVLLQLPSNLYEDLRVKLATIDFLLKVVKQKELAFRVSQTE